MSYVLLADSHTYVCRSWVTWPHGLGWPLLRSEQVRLVKGATRLALR